MTFARSFAITAGNMLGTGILKGLYITAKNLVGSFTNRKERLTTVCYPEPDPELCAGERAKLPRGELLPGEKTRIPPNYRNFPFLVYDGADPDAGERCIACAMCERECPPQCIYIVKDKVERIVNGAKKIVMRPKVFDLDTSVCMGCGICVEVCPAESIKMDHAFEITATDRFHGLLLHKEQLAKPNSYYHQIHPEDAKISDAKLAEKLLKEEAAAAARAAGAGAAKPTVTTTATAPAAKPPAQPPAVPLAS